nr:olfactory receptor 3A2 [Vicugna pacos]
MEPESGTNRTTVTEFILLGLLETEKLQPVVFVLFLFAYLVTVGGNLSILAAILVEPKLHTPMYFFLGNLSVLDIGCITVTVPAMLAHLLSHKHTIPYAACLSQLFFFHLLAGMDCFLLTAMAYDRFLAICRPLTYSIRMSQTVQWILVAVSWACEVSDKDKGVGVFNTVINPILNPLIYSLRNPDVQGALWRVLVGRRSLT